MMPKKPIENKDLIELLSVLKEETPEYPDLVKARKKLFLKQASDFNVSKGNQGGGTSGAGGSSGTSGSNGSGATSSGGIATIGFGISLKSALTFGAIVLLLTGAYVFREKIVSYLDENNIINIEEPATELAPSFEDNNTPESGIIGEGSNTDTGSPEPETIQVTPKPTNSEQSEPISGFEYLICVLRYGAENCK